MGSGEAVDLGHLRAGQVHLKALAEGVDEVGRLAGDSRSGFADASAHVRVALTDDDYGEAYKNEHVPRWEAIDAALGLVQSLLMERGGTLRRAAVNYLDAESRSSAT